MIEHNEHSAYELEYLSDIRFKRGYSETALVLEKLCKDPNLKDLCLQVEHADNELKINQKIYTKTKRQALITFPIGVFTLLAAFAMGSIILGIISFITLMLFISGFIGMLTNRLGREKSYYLKS